VNQVNTTRQSRHTGNRFDLSAQDCSRRACRAPPPSKPGGRALSGRRSVAIQRAVRPRVSERACSRRRRPARPTREAPGAGEACSQSKDRAGANRLIRSDQLFTRASVAEERQVIETKGNTNIEQRDDSQCKKGSRRKRKALFNRRQSVAEAWERA
jgi:hypothetical protein